MLCIRLREKQITRFNYRLMTKDIDYPTFQREKKSSANISDTKQSTMNSKRYQKAWPTIFGHTKMPICISGIRMKAMFRLSTKTKRLDLCRIMESCGIQRIQSPKPTMETLCLMEQETRLSLPPLMAGKSIRSQLVQWLSRRPERAFLVHYVGMFRIKPVQSYNRTI